MTPIVIILEPENPIVINDPDIIDELLDWKKLRSYLDYQRHSGEGALEWPWAEDWPTNRKDE